MKKNILKRVLTLALAVPEAKLVVSLARGKHE